MPNVIHMKHCHNTRNNHFIIKYNFAEKDDDTHSVISTGSRKDNLEDDLGEETETAPECEGEEESITRCVCELTHDDGYMICCDKCL